MLRRIDSSRAALSVKAAPYSGRVAVKRVRILDELTKDFNNFPINIECDMSIRKHVFSY